MDNKINAEEERKALNHKEQQQRSAVNSDKKNDYPLSFLSLENEEESFVKGYN